VTLSGRRVVLGVSGGIASYKACTIARRLTEAGAAVDVVLTASAAEFVRPVTFEALTGRPVLTSLWGRGQALAHIDYAKHPDAIVVAPATANLIARVAHGTADDLLTAILLAATCPVALAPAMNDDMFANSITQKNVVRLRERGWDIVGPATGALAEGPSDRPGRMVEPDEVVAATRRLVGRQTSPLRDKHVLVTAGPTQEALDPVRVITNPSTGRMGFALASAAYARGSQVDLIAGPSMLRAPYGVETIRVRTTNEMLSAVVAQVPKADVVIMAAAPSDFAVEGAGDGKRPRTDGPLSLTLNPTPDILLRVAEIRPPQCRTVGFALEVGDDAAERAREKLRLKSLDMIVLNRADEPGAGFESATNRVTFISKDHEQRFDVMPKEAVAEHILDAVESLL
jgi:phosphopantothenoylcysteine decarboxylase/phosphopantothenate--cysteine ligase